MDIKEIEILIECKRLVEAMRDEKIMLLKNMDKCGKETEWIQKHIARLECALQGKPPIRYSELLNEGR